MKEYRRCICYTLTIILPEMKCNWIFATFTDNRVEGEWPLGGREFEILKSNCADLVNFLKIDSDLTARMHQCGCITMSQMNYLHSKAVPEDRNQDMLDILKRRSLRCYHQFVDCLKQGQCDNTFATRILEHDEGANLPHFAQFYTQILSVTCYLALSQSVVFFHFAA